MSLYGSVIWVPSDRTGATDMALELEQFVRANQPNQVVVAPGSTIKLRDFGKKGTLLSTDHVKIDFGDCVILWDNDAKCVDLNNAANASDEVNVTAIAVENIDSYTPTTKVSIDATLNAKVHDWVAIYSDSANPSKSGAKMGEIKQLIRDQTVDGGGFALNTSSKLSRPSLFVTNVRCRVLSKTAKLSLRGGIWRGNGNNNDLNITTREKCITIIGYVQPELYDMRCEKPWAQFITLTCNADHRIRNITMTDSLNVVDDAEGNQNIPGYTYGVCLYGMNDGGVAHDIKVRNCRHPAGTTDGNSGNTTTWYFMGYPTACTFENVTGWNCYGSLTDSHEEGAHIVFKNITSFYPVQDYANTLGVTHQSRSFNETIENVTCIGGTGGVRISDVDHGEQNRVILRNVTTRYVQNGGANAFGIDIKDRSAANEILVIMENVHMTGSERGIHVGKNAKLVYNNVSANGCLWFMDVDAGAVVIGTGTYLDFTDSPYGLSEAVHYCFRLRSEVGNSPTVVLLDSPVVVQRTTDQPRHFWDEWDTNEVKLVHHPGITLYQPNGGTAMIDRESGETTIDNATGVSTVALGA